MAQDAGVKSIPELRQFGSNLNQASLSLQNLFQVLNGQMNQVMGTWDDDKARAFMSEFEQSKKQIDTIAQNMQQFSGWVVKMCQILEDYHNTRF